MAGRPVAPGAARLTRGGRRAKWGYSWALGPDGSCPPLSKGLGPEKMPRAFYARHRDLLSHRLALAFGVTVLTLSSDPSLTDIL